MNTVTHALLTTERNKSPFSEFVKNSDCCAANDVAIKQAIAVDLFFIKTNIKKNHYKKIKHEFILISSKTKKNFFFFFLKY